MLEISRVGRIVGLSMVFLVAASLAPARAHAGLSLDPVGTFESPVYVTSDPADASRLFVVERAGRIKLTQGDATTTFLNITSAVLSGGERGLLSMAFAPDYATSGRFYVFYTRNAPTGDPLRGDLQIDEITAAGDSAYPATARHVLTIDHSQFANHNGGQLQFGPDGYLYISTGDGGGGGDPLENAQDTGSLLGKILRIDPHPSGGAAYSVPSDNPFVGTASADEVWSYGLRNPWRFSFDRRTGALVIGDVGQASWEEVDFEPPSAGAGRGDNFGWDCREGRHDFELDASCAGLTFTEPVFEYSSASDSMPNCSITGGYVVRDASLGDLAGRYVYADFCAGELRSLLLGLPDASDDRSEGVSVSQPSSFGEDSCGRIYVASLSGPVYRLTGASQASCDQPPLSAPSRDSAPSDTDPPALEISGARRQNLARSRRVRAKLRSDEAAEAVARLAVRGRGKTLFLPRSAKRTRNLTASEPKRVSWRLSRREATRIRKLVGNGVKVRARVRAHATDASGNRGDPATGRFLLTT